MTSGKGHICLNEVTFMRCILAFLIVFMHSFTCYQGGWPPPDGYVDIPFYRWIARISFAFTLEAFVFLSGYLFAFQRITLKRTNDCISLITSKLRRLILPSIIFSSAYFAFFYDYNGFGNMVYNIISGCGHMWFLPMLFWCFIGFLALEKIKINDWWKIVFLLLLYLFWPKSLPLQLDRATNYLIYFYGGYVVYQYRHLLMDFFTSRRILWFWMLFAIAFLILRPLKETITIGNQSVIFFYLITCATREACQLIYASLGTIVFWATAMQFTRNRQIKPETIKLASCCFGIYLFQQFILKGLYYKTCFPSQVGPYLLPWIGFLIAAPISYLLTILLLKTNAGKSLIG